jgi:Zn-dependent protease with chaperone function
MLDIDIFLKCLKLSVAFTLLQIIVTYIPFFLSKKRKREKLQQLILLQPVDFLFSGLFMFLISLFESQFHYSNSFFIMYLEIWLFIVILNSYFFIIFPFIIKFQNKRFIKTQIFENYIYNQYKKTIPVYITSYPFLNAFASGFLSSNRVIVIGKSLVENLTPDEQLAVLSHEQGHHKNRDLLLFYVFMLFSIFCFVCGKDLFFQIAKKSFPNADKSLIVGVFAGLHALIFYVIIFSKISHNSEYKADAYASKVAGQKNIISALKNMDLITDGSLSNGSITHPNLSLRIENIEKMTFQCKV